MGMSFGGNIQLSAEWRHFLFEDFLGGRGVVMVNNNTLVRIQENTSGQWVRVSTEITFLGDNLAIATRSLKISMPCD